MGGQSSVQDDAVVLAVLVAVGLALVLAVMCAQLVLSRLRTRRPVLPEPDRPPGGLGRLVPVGEQVDAEVKRGLKALEMFLLDARRA